MPERRSPLTRLVARHISELLLASARRWAGITPSDRLSGVVFEVVLTAGMSHLPFWRAETGGWIGHEMAVTLARSVSATAIAQSMAIPHTTVRRRADELVAAGLLVRDSAGLRVANAFFADPRLPALTQADVDELRQTCAVLAAAGYEPARRLSDPQVWRVPPTVVARLQLAFAVRAQESVSALYGDFPSAAIVSTIVAVNVREITRTPDLASRYAPEEAPPPDELRRPVSLRALSREVNMPFETVRRRVSGLIERGLVVATDAGVIVPARVLMADDLIANNRLILFHFERMLDTLVQLAVHVRD